MRTTPIAAFACCGLAVACGGKGLVRHALDGGPVLADSSLTGPDLGDLATPDLGGLDEPDGTNPTAIDAAPEIDAAPDAQPDSGRLVPGCTRAGSEPTSLGVLGGQYNDTLAVLGDQIYVGGLTSSGEGRITVVTFGTGAQRIIPLGATLPTKLAARPDALFYIQGRIEQPDPHTTSFVYSNVARLDLATEQVSLLPNPGDYVSPHIESMLDANGDILWIVSYGSPSSLVRWASSTGQADTVLRSDHVSGPILTDGSALYWQDQSREGNVIWSSMPLAGGPILEVWRWPGPPNAPILLAVDEELFYYFFFGDSASGILAMPKAGGPGKTVIPWAAPTYFKSDGNAHYWVDNGSPTLSRAPKAGGQVEIIWNVANRWPRALAVDECNIYWTVLNPYELFVRAK
jgi:hypothetical protein